MSKQKPARTVEDTVNPVAPFVAGDTVVCTIQTDGIEERDTYLVRGVRGSGDDMEIAIQLREGEADSWFAAWRFRLFTEMVPRQNVLKPN